VLRAAIAASSQDAGLHHALGPALTRLKGREEALDELRRAAELDPERARYAYVYAVGLHSADAWASSPRGEEVADLFSLLLRKRTL
jgi:Flp pilus assembly protein TadD